MNEIPNFKLQYKYGSLKGPDAPKYCPDDGYPLKITEEIIEYDSQTGQSITRLRADCTKRVLFNHWHFVQDEHGDWARTM